MSLRKNYMKSNLLKIIISLGLIYFVLTRIHVSAMLEAFESISFETFVIVLLIYMTNLCIGSLKWKILIPEYSFKKLLRFTFVGQFYGLILPGQITGELAKGYRFASESGDGARVTASILVDKVAAIAGLIILGLIGSVFAFNQPPFLTVIVICFLAFAILIFILVSRCKDFFITTLKKMRIPESLVLKIDLLLSHYQSFSASSRVFVSSVVLGVISQAMAIIMNMVLAQSIGVSIGVYEWLWLFAITSFVTLLPITVGGLGLRETVFAANALSLGVRPTLMVAVSLMMYVFQFIFAATGGLVELYALLKKKNEK